MKQTTAALPFLLMLTACSVGGISSASYDGPVRTADSAAVEKCAFLGDVVGTSGLYGTMSKKGIANARSAAYAEAERMGATHLVWTSIGSEYGSSYATGLVYRCE